MIEKKRCPNATQRPVVYGLLIRATFPGFHNKVQFDHGISVCLTPQDIGHRLSDISKKYCELALSKTDLDDIDKCSFAMSKPMQTRSEGDLRERNRVSNDIERFVSVLRIVRPFTGCIRSFFIYSPRLEQYIGPISPSFVHCYAIRENDIDLKEFPLVHLTKAKSLWRNQRYMRRNNARVLIASRIYTSAYLQEFADVRILAFAMGLESLFTSDQAEVTYKLRLRVAKFLTRRFEKKKQISDDIRDAYGVRSRIIHGYKAKISEEQYDKAEIDLRRYLRMTLYRILNNRKTMNAFDDKPVGKYQQFLDRLDLD